MHLFLIWTILSYPGGDCIQEMKALLRWIFSDVFPKNPLPLSKRFCSLPLYAPSAMRCSRATCAGYIARDAWALQLNPPFKHISINDGCSLSKNSWISSRPASWISSSINMVKRNFKRYLINILTSITPPSWNTLWNFIPRRSQIPFQVRPQKRSSHRSPAAAPAQYIFSIKYGHSLVSSLFVQTFKYQQNLPSLNNLWKLYLSEISDPKACPLVRRSSVQHSSSSSSPSSVNGWLQHQTHNLMIIGTHHSLIPAYFPAFFNYCDLSTIHLPPQW